MLEIIRPGASAPGAKAALFDFDGTLSLIRSGWLNIMLDMIVETLLALDTGETAEQLRAEALDFVWPHTGKDTLFQMIEFAGAIRARGGTPLDPQVYKQRFLDTLFRVSDLRTGELRDGLCPPDKYLVPGSRAVDSAVEVARDIEQAGFVLQARMVRAAGKVEREAARAERFENGARPRHQVLVRRAEAVAQLARA